MLSSDGKTINRLPIKFDGSFDDCNFDEAKETRVIIHGIKSDIISPIYINTPVKYFQQKIYNVIVVNWLELSRSSYFSAYLFCFDKIAQKILQFLFFAKRYKNMDFSTTTFVGHSIGAHISGKIGRMLKDKDKTYALGNIIGLDPAGFLFNDQAKRFNDFLNLDIYKRRLGKGDAKFVVCFHTNKFISGAAYNPQCDLDVDFDNGIFQKHCSTDILVAPMCSHEAAIDYLTESLDNQYCFKAVPQPIPFVSYILGITSSSSLIHIGEPVEQMQRARGNYICVTSFPSPYCSFIRDEI